MKQLTSSFFKYVLITICFLLYYQVLKAQHSFISTDKVWSELWQDYEAQEKYSVRYKFEGSTKINDKVYYKLWYSFDNEQPIETWKSWEFFRESNDTVYQHNTGEDAVFYNFALKQGDTIRFRYLHIVDSIKVVTINNVERKKYYLSTDSGEYVEWIEGIGSLNGPVHPFGSYSFYNGRTDLLCVTEKDNEIFNNINFEKCSYTTSINKFDNENNIDVFPNPSTGLFTIEIPHEWRDNITLQIWNEEGKLIHNDMCFDLENNQLFMEKTGLYFCRIRHGKNSATKKVLIW